MGFRFRKSVKIAPGVKLNSGKKSAGISIGNKNGGISVNSKTGVSTRISAPGTGMSYTSKLSSCKHKTTHSNIQNTASNNYLSKTKTDLMKSRWLFFFMFCIFLLAGILTILLKWFLVGAFEASIAVVCGIMAYKGFAYHQEVE